MFKEDMIEVLYLPEAFAGCDGQCQQLLPNLQVLQGEMNSLRVH